MSSDDSPRLITWRGATILVVLFIWTVSAWYLGYDYGTGEPDRLQKEIDITTQENSLLLDALENANQNLASADSHYKSELARWQQVHENLKRKNVPASSCKDEQDYYGTEAAQKFADELDRLRKGWIRENN